MCVCVCVVCCSTSSVVVLLHTTTHGGLRKYERERERLFQDTPDKESSVGSGEKKCSKIPGLGNRDAFSSFEFKQCSATKYILSREG